MIADAVSKQAASARGTHAWIPAAVVLLVMGASKILYNLPWSDLAPSIHQPVTFISGLTLNLAIALGPSVIYLLGRFRGAMPRTCIVACLITPVAWNIWEIIRVTAYFSLAESLYYGLNSVFLGSLAFATFQMGLCETVYRFRRKRAGETVRVAGPILVALSGLALVYVFGFWAMGQHWFYLYQEVYKALFH